MEVGDRNIKLTIWDTAGEVQQDWGLGPTAWCGSLCGSSSAHCMAADLAGANMHPAHLYKLCVRAGQERFRALTSTFYRGAVGIIFGAYSRPRLAQRNCREGCSWQHLPFASTQKPLPLCCACWCMCVCLPAVYDVTRRETLASLSGSWMEELACYDPHPDVARMVVANKVDQVGGCGCEGGQQRVMARYRAPLTRCSGCMRNQLHLTHLCLPR